MMTEMWEKALADRNEPVQMYSASCVIWKTEHPDCKGCPDELPCAKLGALLIQAVKIGAILDAGTMDMLRELMK